MRILMISDHADPLAKIGSKDAGGQNIFVRYLAHHLGQRGVHVDIYTRWDRSNKKEVVSLAPNIRVIRIKAGPKKHIPRDAFLTVVPEFIVNMKAYIRNERLLYDAIHANHWGSGMVGLEIAKAFSLPHFIVYHALGQVRYDVLKEFKEQQSDYMYLEERLAAERKIALQSTAVIATSPIEKEQIHTLFNVPKNRIAMITEGVDTEIFYPIEKQTARNSLGMPKRKIILYVGRLQRRKGIDTLLQSLPMVLDQHPEAHLYIVGGANRSQASRPDDVELQRLEAIINELKLARHVTFMGAKQQHELPLYYSAADVCVVPSYYEPFGIVPLEAMACGTPVVASKTGGLQYTVEDGITGYHATPRDPVSFSEKINLVMKNGKDVYTLNCLARIEKHFAWKKIAYQYDQFFRQAQLSLKPVSRFPVVVNKKI